MAGPLSGKVALVTGGGQGVGRGIALALAKAGADVAVVGRRIENTRAVAQELAALGVRAEPFVCDVKDGAAILTLVAAVVESLQPGVLCGEGLSVKGADDVVHRRSGGVGVGADGVGAEQQDPLRLSWVVVEWQAYEVGAFPHHAVRADGTE